MLPNDSPTTVITNDTEISLENSTVLFGYMLIRSDCDHLRVITSKVTKKNWYFGLHSIFVCKFLFLHNVFIMIFVNLFVFFILQYDLNLYLWY